MIEVMLSSGEYSDYSILGLFMVESREWMEAQWAVFRDGAMARMAADNDQWVNRIDFAAWIEARGAVRLEQVEAHIGDYGIEKDDVIQWR